MKKEYKDKSSYFQAFFPDNQEIGKREEKGTICDEISIWIVHKNTKDKGNCDAEEDQEDVHVDNGKCLVTTPERVDLVVESVMRSEGGENEVVEIRHFILKGIGREKIVMFLKRFFWNVANLKSC